MSTGFLFVDVITQDPHDIDYHSKDPRTGDYQLKLRKEDDWCFFLPTRDFEAGDKLIIINYELHSPEG